MPALRPLTDSIGNVWTLRTHVEDDARNAPDDVRTVCVEARSSPWLLYIWLPPGWESMPEIILRAAVEGAAAETVADFIALDGA